MSRVEHIGRATLYLGRCEDVLPALARPDRIIGDPPYGQGQKTNTFYAGGTRTSTVIQRNGKTLQMTPNGWPEGIEGDEEPFDPRWLLPLADGILLWGEHKFGHMLPKGRRLVWDKVPTGKQRDQGDGEIAWTNIEPDAPLRIFRLLWDGVCVGAGARHEVTAGQKRHHPTQKPEVLMAWCLQQAKAEPGMTICDPYMGSGSTGVAAMQAGCGFVGIESEPLYFETACRRIEDAQRQGSLFNVGEAA